MRGILTVVLLGLGAPALVAANDDEATRLAAGRAAIAPFQAALQAALKSGLAGGPVAALDVCHVEAPAIARDLAGPAAAGTRVAVGRTSHRLRNPANTPRDWVRPLLDDYVRSAANGPRTVQLGPGRWGYVEPIIMQSACLGCHGSPLEESVADRLRVLYPQDAATGFAVGDFRGLFWAEFTENP